nr:hypothetical protein GCM10020093_002910 [Planobispora longispora]
MVVDATPYHDAGGSDAEELGCSIATGVAYLRALTDGGLTLEQAFGQLEFRYAATADQFLTIAKLRAARRLWARVAEACGVSGAAGSGSAQDGSAQDGSAQDGSGEAGRRAAPGRQVQHAVTSSAMMTARDPWVNMLRTTVACFAAGVGGADAVTVQPFDARLGLPDAFSRRIARNTQSLLVEEAGVARVTDPAGGSFYAERLTEDLAVRAWEWFQEIERAGGMAAALDSGLVADRLAVTRERRAANIARRRDPVTGVSEFPNLTEKLRCGRPGRARGQARGRGRGRGRPRTARSAPQEGCRGSPTPRSSRRCATWPTPGTSARASSWPRSARWPRTRPAPRSRPTCSRPGCRHRPVRAGDRPGTDRRRLRRERHAGRLPVLQRPAVRRARRGRGRGAARGRRAKGLAGGEGVLRGSGRRALRRVRRPGRAPRDLRRPGGGPVRACRGPGPGTDGRGPGAAAAPRAGERRPGGGGTSTRTDRTGEVTR